jgi:hypothetical protein
MGERATRYTVSETRPDGIRLTVMITIPDELAYPDMRELIELAQMGLVQTGRIFDRDADAALRRAQAAKEVPF